jgi:hypothetical protein
MNVKAFIDEASEAALKIDAANRQVEVAKDAVEAARAALEASKGGVDAAKHGVAAAKEVFETYAERADQYGLTRSKFKDVVERMKSVLADIGAIEPLTAEAAEPIDQKKPRVARKPRGDQFVAIMDAAVRADPDILVAELTDPASRALAESAALAGHQEFSTEPTIQIDTPSDTPAEVIGTADNENQPANGLVEVATLEDLVEYSLQNNLRRHRDEGTIMASSDPEVIAEVEKVIDIVSTAKVPELEAISSDEEIEDELDNSIAEQELLDLVDEVGTTDDDVKKVLAAAIKVVAWHTAAVANAVLRTHSSPLTLAGVLVVEDAGYAPKDIQDAYAVALSFGGEKLAAAISWFNSALDLLADAKPIDDFRFTPAEEPNRARKVEPTAEKQTEVAPTVEIEITELSEPASTETTEALDEVIDATAETDDGSETIEDMQLFAAPEEAEVNEDVVVTPEPVQLVERAVPVPPRVSKPSWLKQGV